LLARVRGVVFDVDGVLLDARPSYHAVSEEAARRAVTKLVGEAQARAVAYDRVSETPQFKAAGHFNDDWETSRGIALLLWLRATGQAPALKEFLAKAQGFGIAGLAVAYEIPPELSQESISLICSSLYGGSKCRELFGVDPLPGTPERGLWENETVLPDPALLEAVAQRFPLALFTGRNAPEARLAMQLCKLKIADDRLWVADGRPRKPDPAGLVWLCHALLKGPDDTSRVLSRLLVDTAEERRA
jgi:phosphoglycolate phosphatase-like HAD superfamily hydrolase